MKKKKSIIIVCAALLLVVVVTALLFSNKYEPPFWVKQEIEDNWVSQFHHAFPGWYDKKTFNGVFYYGKYNGYHVLFTNDGMRPAVMTSITIGDEVFPYGSGFSLYACKDGKFEDLQKIYKDGLIDDTQIVKISKIHFQYVCSDEYSH